MNSYATSLVNTAYNFTYTSSFLDNYSFYIPTGNDIVDGRGLGLPQEMIGMAVPTSPAPEPSSLLLLGSGLFGLAGVVRRTVARA